MDAIKRVARSNIKVFFELGLNTMEVSAITGHKTLSMLKRYTHLKATDLALKLG
ncbi:MAG: integrase [Methylococcales bacterium]